MKRSTINNCSIIEVPKISDRSGNISIVEGLKNLPFEPKRLFYLYDIPAGESRGAHAHKECHQFIIAASGSFEVVLNDGQKEHRFSLNRSYYGVYVPKMMWRMLENFSQTPWH